MDNVLSFHKEVPHTTGDAICAGCKHAWVAVVPKTSSTAEIECPSCGCMKGHFKWKYGAPVGGSEYTCNCGSKDYFIMKRDATSQPTVNCRGCGTESRGWFE